MKQVLSQQEIDSLLDALDTGEIDTFDLEEKEDNVKAYDFRRPIKLSKEYINSLYMVFENFAKIGGNLLSSQLNEEVSLGVAVIEQISYDEFIRSIPKMTFLGIFNARPLTGMQIVEINPKFCMQIVDLVCGGGEAGSIKTYEDKEEFTDIELGILEETLLVILDAFKSAWSDIVEMETSIETIDTNPQLIQTMSPNEPVVLMSFTVNVLNSNSFMNMCIPFTSFENIMDKLSFRSWFDADKEVNEKDEAILRERILSSSVNLNVILGNTGMTVEDFLNLEDGDILQLDKEIDRPLTMYVEDKPHFYVKPGLYNGSYGVEVLQYIEEDVE